MSMPPAPSVLPATYLTVWKIANPLATPLTVTSIQRERTDVLQRAGARAATRLRASHSIAAIRAILKAIYRNGFLYTARDTGYTDQATTVTYDVIDTSTMKLASQARLLNTNAFYPAFDVPATTPLGTQFATANLITGTTTAANGTLDVCRDCPTISKPAKALSLSSPPAHAPAVGETISVAP